MKKMCIRDRFPVGTQRRVIHRVSMILRGDEAFLRPYHTDRLVMATVSVLQFVDGGASGFCQQLVTHADTADRFIAGKCFADILNGRIAGIRVAGAVTDEQTVVCILYTYRLLRQHLSG